MSKAPQVEILGVGDFAGSASAISDYTVTEDATPLDITNLTGGVGGIDFKAVEDPSTFGSVLLRGEPFLLTDPFAGAVKGYVDNVTVNDGIMNISASTLLLPLVATKKASPYSGTLAGAINYYAALCGISSGIQFDSALATIPVALPPWNADVWTQLKKLAAIYKFEIAAVNDVIVIRQLRQRILDVNHTANVRFSYGRDDAAREVQVYYYQNVPVTNMQVYPRSYMTPQDRQIIAVEAGETVTMNIPVDMWIQTLSQPTYQSSVGPSDVVTSSQYTAVDSDSRPVQPLNWERAGGKMVYAIGADGRSVDVTVTGASTQYRQPYRIAGTSQDRTYQYSSLYIVATGIAFAKQMVYSATGAPTATAPVDDVVVIDDPMVSTVANAYHVLSNALRGASGNRQTIEMDASQVNRRGETGQIVYPSFADFDGTIGSSTFTAYNSTISGKTFKVWDADQAALVSRNFESQAFGGVNGARTLYRDHYYRVRSATSSMGHHSWVAEPDTLFSELDAAWPAKTFTQFDAFWSGRTFSQFAMSTLAH